MPPQQGPPLAQLDQGPNSQRPNCNVVNPACLTACSQCFCQYQAHTCCTSSATATSSTPLLSFGLPHPMTAQSIPGHVLIDLQDNVFTRRGMHAVCHGACVKQTTTASPLQQGSKFKHSAAHSEVGMHRAMLSNQRYTTPAQASRVTMPSCLYLQGHTQFGHAMIGSTSATKGPMPHPSQLLPCRPLCPNRPLTPLRPMALQHLAVAGKGCIQVATPHISQPAQVLNLCNPCMVGWVASQRQHRPKHQQQLRLLQQLLLP